MQANTSVSEIVAVPSWSGRNTKTKPVMPEEMAQSPSPHGRVGTRWFVAAQNRPKLVAVPSWSGRNRVHHRNGMEECEESPSPHGRVGTKANFRVLTVKRRETEKGLQSTFDCPKTLRGSTATDPSKLGHFRLKSPPRLYPVFKVLKTA